MDVVCGRCRAEYEFDDALISERGTTVRCTNCGLQFKVFPPVGRRAPEVWRVFDPGDSVLPPVEYDSLAALQKAIATGDVTSAHLFARGEEPPRPFAEIAELQPLLRQPVSDRPPPPDPSNEEKAQASPLEQHGSSTVLGIQARPDPASRVAERSLPNENLDADVAVTSEGEQPSAEERENAVVPALPDGVTEHDSPSNLSVPESAPPPSPARPRVRSALSVESSSASPSGSPPSSPISSSSPRALSLAPRSSLRSTLSGSLPPIQPVDSAPETKPSSPVSEPSVMPAVESAISSGEESEDHRGQLTPTPLGMRALAAVDSEPASVTPTRPARRRARGGWVVLSILVGGGAFALYSTRDRVSDVVGATSAESAVDEEASPRQLGQLKLAEISWLKRRLFASEEAPFPGLSEIAESDAPSSWALVNLRRIQGDLAGARKMASSVTDKSGAGYALALLDLAESPSAPPWPSIIERLKEASVGERGLYLSRSTYIWALAESGKVTQARADFNSLARLSGASEAPLFADLKAYLEAKSGADLAGTGTGDVSEKTTAQRAQEKTRVEVSEPMEKAPEKSERAQPSSQSPDPGTPPEAKSKPGQETASQADKSTISASVKAKVSQADSRWRAGDKDGAVVLYQQVVSEIGTTHFLGQRSASRIRLANREKAEGQ